jgi:hypothetical protein
VLLSDRNGTVRLVSTIVDTVRRYGGDLDDPSTQDVIDEFAGDHERPDIVSAVVHKYFELHNHFDSRTDDGIDLNDFVMAYGPHGPRNHVTGDDTYLRPGDAVPAEHDPIADLTRQNREEATPFPLTTTDYTVHSAAGRPFTSYDPAAVRASQDFPSSLPMQAEITHDHPPLRIAGDASLAVNGTYAVKGVNHAITEAKEFYATEEVFENATRALRRAGAGVELVLDPANSLTVDHGDTQQTLHRITAKFDELPSAICRSFATGVLGGLPDTAVFRDGHGRVADVRIDPMHPVEATGSHTLAEALADVAHDDRELTGLGPAWAADRVRADGRELIARDEDGVLPGERYGTALRLDGDNASRPRMDELAWQIGVNQHAWARVGEAYLHNSIKSADQDGRGTLAVNFARGGDTGAVFGYHYATVIAESADGLSQVALVNYRRSGINSRVIDQALHDTATTYQGRFQEVIDDLRSAGPDVRTEHKLRLAEALRQWERTLEDEAAWQQARKAMAKLAELPNPNELGHFKFFTRRPGETAHEQQAVLYDEEALASQHNVMTMVVAGRRQLPRTTAFGFDEGSHVPRDSDRFKMAGLAKELARIAVWRHDNGLPLPEVTVTGHGNGSRLIPGSADRTGLARATAVGDRLRAELDAKLASLLGDDRSVTAQDIKITQRSGGRDVGEAASPVQEARRRVVLDFHLPEPDAIRRPVDDVARSFGAGYREHMAAAPALALDAAEMRGRVEQWSRLGDRVEDSGAEVLSRPETRTLLGTISSRLDQLPETQRSKVVAAVNDLLVAGSVKPVREHDLNRGGQFDRRTAQPLSPKQVHSLLADMAAEMNLGRDPFEADALRDTGYDPAEPMPQRVIRLALSNLAPVVRAQVVADPLFVKAMSSAHADELLMSPSGLEQQQFLNSYAAAVIDTDIRRQVPSLVGLLHVGEFAADVIEGSLDFGRDTLAAKDRPLFGHRTLADVVEQRIQGARDEFTGIREQLSSMLDAPTMDRAVLDRLNHRWARAMQKLAGVSELRHNGADIPVLTDMPQVGDFRTSTAMAAVRGVDRPMRRLMGIDDDGYRSVVGPALADYRLDRPVRLSPVLRESPHAVDEFWENVNRAGGVRVDRTRHALFVQAVRRDGDEAFVIADPLRNGVTYLSPARFVDWARRNDIQVAEEQVPTADTRRGAPDPLGSPRHDVGDETTPPRQEQNTTSLVGFGAYRLETPDTGPSGQPKAPRLDDAAPHDVVPHTLKTIPEVGEPDLVNHEQLPHSGAERNEAKGLDTVHHAVIRAATDRRPSLSIPGADHFGGFVESVVSGLSAPVRRPSGGWSSQPPVDAKPLTVERISGEYGIPEENQARFQHMVELFNVVIEVRPSNPDAVPWLRRGSISKPAEIKAKTINQLDVYLGASREHVGLVGYFQPTEPDLDRLAGMGAFRQKAIGERFDQRAEEYRSLAHDMAQYEARGKFRVRHGVVEGVGADGEFHPVTGDHDLFHVRLPEDGRPLEKQAYEDLVWWLTNRTMAVEHGAHLSWKPEGEFQQKIFDRIVRRHSIVAKHVRALSAAEPLIRFSPGEKPKLVYADAETISDASREQPSARVPVPIDQQDAPVFTPIDWTGSSASPVGAHWDHGLANSTPSPGETRHPGEDDHLAQGLTSVWRLSDSDVANVRSTATAHVPTLSALAGDAAPNEHVTMADIDLVRDDAPVNKVDVVSEHGWFSYDVRRMEVKPGAWVREATVNVHVDGSSVEPNDVHELLALMDLNAEAQFNHERLPNGDQFRVRLVQIDNRRGSDASVKIVADGPAESHAVWSLNDSGQRLVHKVGTLLGLSNHQVGERLTPDHLQQLQLKNSPKSLPHLAIRVEDRQGWLIGRDDAGRERMFPMERVTHADLRDGSGRLIGVSFDRDARETEKAHRWAKGKKGDQFYLREPEQSERRVRALKTTVPGISDESAVLMIHADAQEASMIVRGIGQVYVEARGLADIAMRTEGFRTAVESGRRTVMLLACNAGEHIGPGGLAHDLGLALRHEGVSDRVFAASTEVGPTARGGVRVTELWDGGNWNIFGDMLPSHETAIVDEIVQAMRNNWRYAVRSDTRSDGKIDLSDRAKTVALAKALADDVAWRLLDNGGRLDLADVLKKAELHARPDIVAAVVLSRITSDPRTASSVRTVVHEARDVTVERAPLPEPVREDSVSVSFERGETQLSKTAELPEVDRFADRFVALALERQANGLSLPIAGVVGYGKGSILGDSKATGEDTGFKRANQVRDYLVAKVRQKLDLLSSPDSPEVDVRRLVPESAVLGMHEPGRANPREAVITMHVERGDQPRSVGPVPVTRSLAAVENGTVDRKAQKIELAEPHGAGEVRRSGDDDDPAPVRLGAVRLSTRSGEERARSALADDVVPREPVAIADIDLMRDDAPVNSARLGASEIEAERLIPESVARGAVEFGRANPHEVVITRHGEQGDQTRSAPPAAEAMLASGVGVSEQRFGTDDVSDGHAAIEHDERPQPPEPIRSRLFELIRTSHQPEVPPVEAGTVGLGAVGGDAVAVRLAEYRAHRETVDLVVSMVKDSVESIGVAEGLEAAGRLAAAVPRALRVLESAGVIERYVREAGDAVTAGLVLNHVVDAVARTWVTEGESAAIALAETFGMKGRE